MNTSVGNTYIYDFMKDFDENTMKFVESDWHHAYLSYFNLTPTQDNNFSNIEISQSDIINIIKIYSSNPPRGNKYYRPILDSYTQISFLETEKKGEKTFVYLMPTIKPDISEKDVSKILQNIMSEASKKFKEKTGRDLTYSEIRELYG